MSQAKKKVKARKLNNGVVRKIFVIMPFSEALSRSKEDLDAFYDDNIKCVIESDNSLAFKYEVSRSGSALDMTESIIKSIYEADVVLCDLSGKEPNPNVMYELGLRFALGDKPVILIREQHSENKKIFDIQGLFTQPYRSTRYGDLQKHLISKLLEFEQFPESYRSPILKALSKDSQVINSVMRRQLKGMIQGLSRGLFACEVLLRRRIRTCLPAEVLGSMDPKVCPTQPWDVWAFIKQPQPDLNFAALNFSPPAIPGMLGLLSFYNFFDDIHTELSGALYGRLNYLYYHYWAGAELQCSPSQYTYFDFIKEVINTHDAAIFIEQFLSSNNEDEKNGLAKRAIELLIQIIPECYS